MVTPTVVGGRHHGASFMPTNGDTTRRDSVERQIVAVRSPRVKNMKGKLLDEMEKGFRMIEARRLRGRRS